jgi:hypothetical protein
LVTDLQQRRVKMSVEKTEPTLSIGDLAAVVRLIDVCARRGAFEGAEMQDVGELRAKYATFIEANRPPAEEQPTSAGEEGTADSEGMGDPREPGEG